MDPKQLLEAVAEVYANCSTYRDSGQVTTQFLSSERTRTSIRPFTTAFRRPDRFRFEYMDRYHVGDEWKRYIVWADGPTVRAWWDVLPGREEPESLGLALAAATGVSGGSAHTMPALLMPDRVGGRRLIELRELRSLGDEPLGEVTCFRLSGRFPVHRTGQKKHAERSPLTIWINRDTMLVRRIEHTNQFETFRAETLTEYTPVVGALLSEDELRFGAPEAAADERRAGDGREQ
jgi:hypothetical protein